MTIYGGVDVQINICLTSALAVGEWSAWRPYRFTPGEKAPGTHWLAYEADFFNLPNPSSRTMALGSTQPLTEIRTRNFPGDKKRPARRADNIAATYELNVWKCGSLNLSQP
jgi:hypothetical protein